MHSKCRKLLWTSPVLFLVWASLAFAGPPVLFQNVRIFDGVELRLRAGHVLVQDGLIKRIAESPISPPPGTLVLDAENRVLTPGFIDLHAHLTYQMPKDEMHVHPWVTGAVAAKAAQFYLENGFTTVRDGGGTHPDFARAVDRGQLAGPRIFPSGAIVSQTSGHGDFRLPHAPHPRLSATVGEMYLGHGLSVLADGTAETLAAVRENLKWGATQIKIMGGGGVASDYDPIHTLQPSPGEIRAAVQAASDWGTYVMAHAYTSEAVQRLVNHGVKVIEHGLLIDDETAKLCAAKDIVISTQVLVFRLGADLPGMTPENAAKMRQVLAGQDNLIRLVKKYNITTGFGTDLVFGAYTNLGREFTARADYWSPAEILRQATSESARVIRLAGKLNRHGNFGEVREGWVADLLLIDGSPLENISLLESPAKALALIMKNGEIFSNRLKSK